MELGIDVSTYFEEMNSGVKYYIDNKEIDVLDAFRNNNVNWMRIRIWNHPYDEKGHKYLGGTCDLDNFIKLAKLAQIKGYKILADFHCSDFWVDPVKQFIPKAWVNLNQKEMEEALYQFIYESLLKIKENDIDLGMIQIGNEITNGMLWPNGHLDDMGPNKVRGNYQNYTNFLKQGFKACDELYPNALKMIHFERSYDHYVYNELLTQLNEYDVKFDILGVSYYPYWHHSFEELFDNLTKCQKEFNVKIAIAEMGYAYTLDDYTNQEEGELVINHNNQHLYQEISSKYPFTKLGQAQYVHDFLAKCQSINVAAVFYWEPIWIPGENSCWASKEAKKYIQEEYKKGTRNEWANQCLFDYKGNKNPSFDEYKI